LATVAGARGGAQTIMLAETARVALERLGR
jgi:hypothetical protein